MNKNKVLSVIIVLVVVFSSIFSASSIVAYAEYDLNDYYAFIEKKRTLSKNGEVENVLIFSIDANKYTNIYEKNKDKMSDLDVFLSKVQPAMMSIKALFDEKQIKVSDINPKSKVEIVLSRYSSPEELELRNGYTDLDTPQSQYNNLGGVVYKKYQSRRKFFFNDINDERIKEAINIFKGIDSNIERYMFKETYIYPYSLKRLVSNADSIRKDNSTNLYVHEYHANYSDISQKVVVFTQSGPNATFWYGISIGASIVVLGLLTILLYNYSNKNKKA